MRARPAGWLASVLNGRVSRERAHVMRDWPHALKLNATTVALARALFYGVAEVYGYCLPDFEALPGWKKQRLVELQVQAVKDARDIIAGAGPKEVA